MDNAWDDYLFWQGTDKAMLKRINRVIKDCERDPFSGIGKPEPLKYEVDGAWSRRIDKEHRFVYVVDGDDLIILQVRFHY